MIIIETNQKALQSERGKLAAIIIASASPNIIEFAKASLAALQWIEYGGDSPSIQLLKSITASDETNG
jgi:hypothetical protein